MALKDKVEKLIREAGNLESSQRITPNHTLDDLRFHQNTLEALIELLEINFEIEIENNHLFTLELPQIKLGDIISLVQNKIMF